MNKDKIIKDLKEQNRKLKNQYELQEVRLYSSQHKIDKLENEILEYKGIEGQLLATIDEKNKIINKVREYIHNHQLVFELSSKEQIQKWFDEFYAELLNILRGEE